LWTFPGSVQKGGSKFDNFPNEWLARKRRSAVKNLVVGLCEVEQQVMPTERAYNKHVIQSLTSKPPTHMVVKVGWCIREEVFFIIDDCVNGCSE
jgi:hypothetical protein